MTDDDSRQKRDAIVGITAFLDAPRELQEYILTWRPDLRVLLNHAVSRMSSSSAVERTRLQAACVKCGGTDLSTRFDASVLTCGWSGREERRGREAEFAGPHLHRMCRTCSWQWAEVPLDARSDVGR